MSDGGWLDRLSSGSTACRLAQWPVVWLDGLSSGSTACRPAQWPVIWFDGLSSGSMACRSYKFYFFACLIGTFLKKII